MKRHKRFYFKPAEDNPELTRVVMIMRRPKKQSRIRRIMFWAWHFQSDKQFIKNLFTKISQDSYSF